MKISSMITILFIFVGMIGFLGLLLALYRVLLAIGGI